jgi:hypothetical protein
MLLKSGYRHNVREYSTRVTGELTEHSYTAIIHNSTVCTFVTAFVPYVFVEAITIILNRLIAGSATICALAKKF